jgi:hypothetical protein
MAYNSFISAVKNLNQPEIMHRSIRIKERFIECLENGELTIGDELEIIEYMVKRLNPISQAEYARKQGISEPAAKKRIDSGKEAFITIANQRLVV